MSRYHYNFKDEYFTNRNAGSIHLVSKINRDSRKRFFEGDELVKIKNISSPANSHIISITGTCLATNQEIVLGSDEYRIRHSVIMLALSDEDYEVVKYKNKIFKDGDDIGIILVEAITKGNRVVCSYVLLGNQKIWKYNKRE